MFQARTSVSFFPCVCESGIIFIIEAPMSLQAAYKTKCKTHTYCLSLWTQPFPDTPNFISLQRISTVNYLVAKQFLTFLCNQKRPRAKVLSKGLVSSLPSMIDTHQTCMHGLQWQFNSLISWDSQSHWQEYAVCYGSLLLTLSHVRHCTELMMVPSNMSEMTLLYFLCCFLLFGDADWARIKRT